MTTEERVEELDLLGNPEFFERNLKALEEAGKPNMASIIRFATPLNRLALCYTKKGMRNCIIVGDDWMMALYHMERGEERVAHNLQNAKMTPGGATILVGAGLGYHLKHLLDNIPTAHNIFVIEPEPEFWRRTFSYYDLSEHITSGRLNVIPPFEDKIDALMSLLAPLITLHEVGFVAEPGRPQLGGVHRELFEKCVRKFQTAAALVGTMDSIGWKLVENLLENWKLIPQTFDISRLEDLAGLPILSVSSGPSLQKSVPFIKRANENAIIIAPIQALGVMKAHKCMPDLVTALDFSDGYRQLFEPWYGCGIPLVAQDTVNHECFLKWEGPKCLIPAARMLGIAELAYKGKTVALSTNNVSHVNMNLAHVLGATTVVLVGHDFALTEHDYHETQITATRNIKDPEAIFDTSGQDGGVLHSAPQLVSALELLNARIRELEFKAYNVTPGGAQIPNAESMSETKALDMLEELGSGVERGREELAKFFATPHEWDMAAATAALRIVCESAHRMVEKVDYYKERVNEEREEGHNEFRNHFVEIFSNGVMKDAMFASCKAMHAEQVMSAREEGATCVDYKRGSLKFLESCKEEFDEYIPRFEEIIETWRAYARSGAEQGDDLQPSEAA